MEINSSANAAGTTREQVSNLSSVQELTSSKLCPCMPGTFLPRASRFSASLCCNARDAHEQTHAQCGVNHASTELQPASLIRGFTFSPPHSKSPVLLTHSLDGERSAHVELVACGWVS